jgi:hypothetical protein
MATEKIVVQRRRRVQNDERPDHDRAKPDKAAI